MATTAALLTQGRLLDRLSRPLTLPAFGALLVAPRMGVRLPWASLTLLAAIGMAGLLQAWFAFRVAFDAALFQALGTDGALDGLPSLDGTLTGLGLMPEGKAGRPPVARARGATRLLAIQARLVVLQVALILGGAALRAA